MPFITGYQWGVLKNKEADIRQTDTCFLFLILTLIPNPDRTTVEFLNICKLERYHIMAHFQAIKYCRHTTSAVNSRTN